MYGGRWELPGSGFTLAMFQSAFLLLLFALKLSRFGGYVHVRWSSPRVANRKHQASEKCALQFFYNRFALL